MSSRTLRRLAVGALTGAAALALVAGPAAAHVTVSPPEAPAGGYTKLDVRVPHGCDGAATEVVRVQIPEGITSVTPQVVTGWEIEIEMEELDEPMDAGHGEQITERPAEVVWTGGPLEDEYLEEFGLSVRMPEGDEGEIVYFPAVQECEGGEEAAWIELPDEGGEGEDLEHPAPGVVLTAGGDGYGDPAQEATTDTVAAAATSDAGGTDAVAVAALVVALLALAAGVGGIVLARKS
jgi:periplasmic copper chaperone A